MGVCGVCGLFGGCRGVGVVGTDIYKFTFTGGARLLAVMGCWP